MPTVRNNTSHSKLLGETTVIFIGRTTYKKKVDIVSTFFEGFLFLKTLC